MVLLQSKTLTVDDPAFRAAIADTLRTVRSFPEVQKVESPLDPGHAGLVSEDGHSAMVQFTPQGTYEEAILYIDTIVAAVDEVEARHPASRSTRSASRATRRSTPRSRAGWRRRGSSRSR